ncbi:MULTISPECIES: hypothetical protein [unclassified Paenibacillus]|uniref:hypothetical protein n=1 Tax=unclassified Paenibacillus TaxID=185978 RepID=UPI002404AE74|nr:MULTISPECIES: hypothetical protein [unclassified Paenibacillus]MDF9845192.1 hypothetical protein [Paenibacillus sp. PastF-2]MDF9850316.1 hypothetical protein [Paenibacillus sp. PastM-2]MDF9856981.1 hypothetical protein [Paenibacillus sp. PastF-1]MDH6482162.1 hypothetical protein [Paenibacillus sp. PastH-2]MDH6509674.1 hypothetical protein [Paenibacillus sp. PastM-3]
MDYGAFFADVQAWIGQANQAAAHYGMSSPEFWQWVSGSAGSICSKYQDHPLAIKQMQMLSEWLEGVLEKQQRGG